MLWLGFDTEGFNALFCLVLGVAGILAPNPMRLIVDTPAWVDSALMSWYIGLFRLFCLAQLEMIAQGTSAPHVVAFCVFIAYLVYFHSNDRTSVGLLSYSAISA